MYFFGNFTNPGEFVVDFFEDTFWVEKSFLMLPETRSLVYFDMYESCVNYYMKIFIIY